MHRRRMLDSLHALWIKALPCSIPFRVLPLVCIQQCVSPVEKACRRASDHQKWFQLAPKSQANLRTAIPETKGSIDHSQSDLTNRSEPKRIEATQADQTQATASLTDWPIVNGWMWLCPIACLFIKPLHSVDSYVLLVLVALAGQSGP